MSAIPDNVVKFMFDTDLTGVEDSGEGPSEDAGEETAPPPLKYTDADLEAARAQGYGDGLAAGQAQAEQSLERQIALVLGAIEEHFAAMAQTDQEARRASVGDIVTLSRAIARKVAGDLIEQNPIAIVEAVASECLARLYGEPRVVLRVAAAQVDAIRAHLDGLPSRTGFSGDLDIVGDPDLHGAECHIEWRSGGVERRTEAVWQEVTDLIDRFVVDQKPEPVPDERPTADQETLAAQGDDIETDRGDDEPAATAEVAAGVVDAADPVGEVDDSGTAAPESPAEAGDGERTIATETAEQAPSPDGDFAPLQIPVAPTPRAGQPQQLAEVLGPELRAAVAKAKPAPPSPTAPPDSGEPPEPGD